MKLALEKLIPTAFLLAVGLLIILGFFAYRSVNAINDAIAWEMHTQEVLQKLDGLLLTTITAETELRGYVITRNKSYLETFDNAEPETQTNIANLKLLISDNPAQIERLAVLERSISEKINISKETRLQIETNPDKFIPNTKGKEAMDKVRVNVQEMKAIETSLLRGRENELSNTFSWASFLLIIAIIVGIILLTLGNILIYAENRKRTIAELKLQNVNRNLEERVTDRTKNLADSNEALQHSEVFNRATIDSLSAHIAVVDRTGKIVTVNKAWTKFADDNQQNTNLISSHPGVNYLELYRSSCETNETLNIVSEKLAQILDGKLKEFSIEYLCHSSSEKRWFLLNLNALETPEGGAVISHTNITARFLAEENLRNSEEFNRSIFESSPDCVKILDLEGNLLSMNKTGMCIMEIDDFQLFIGKDWKKFWKGASEATVIKTIESAIAGTVENFVGACETAKGTPKFWEVSVGPIYNANGKVVRLISVSRDITERREAEAEREKLFVLEKDARRDAETANRMRDEFLATVSHELRNPLNAILGWGRLLQKNQLDVENKQKAIETIVRNAESQNHLIEDLLDVSRIIAGKLRLDIATIKPDDFVKAAIDTMRPAADAKNIKINTLIGEELNKISGDTNRLQQVVWNLLSNAVKFTPKNGEVKISVECIDSMIEIAVKDNGTGISADFLPHVFDRFRQADASTVRRFGGLGLGLAIVRHITEMHGGTVEVFSDGEGNGAVFTVKLPIAPLTVEVEQVLSTNEAGAVSQIKEPNINLKGLFILTVDDERDTCQLLAQILTHYGANVKTVLSASEAMVEFLKKQPDILISDIGMPEEDGYTLIQKIRALPDENIKKMPVIALTAFARPQDRMKALAAGFQTHVSKPVEPNELATVIASLTERLLLDELEN